jgi:hypothetical protein
MGKAAEAAWALGDEEEILGGGAPALKGWPISPAAPGKAAEAARDRSAQLRTGVTGRTERPIGDRGHRDDGTPG